MNEYNIMHLTRAISVCLVIYAFYTHNFLFINQETIKTFLQQRIDSRIRVLKATLIIMQIKNKKIIK